MRKRRSLILFIFLASYVCYYLSSPSSSPSVSFTLKNPKSGQTNGKNKLILLWNQNWYPNWDIDEETLKGCPYQCDFTNDHSFLGKSDALLYSAVTWERTTWDRVRLYFNYYDTMPKRDEENWHELWTFFRIESPTKSTYNFNSLVNLFNWTATYRLDSEVPYRYGSFQAIRAGDIPSINQEVDSFRNKSLIGWMNSHRPCSRSTSSNREELAFQLEKHIPVDVYGICGRLGQYPCSGQEDRCYGSLSKKYKFWLVFENSLCVDYLSEKIYLALKFGMVPIVYAHPSFKTSVPPNSFIDVFNFKRMEDLAKYILYLDENPMEYLKYFEWRKYYRVKLNHGKPFWCEFCTKLHYHSKDKPKEYGSIHDWWYFNYTKNSMCMSIHPSL